MSPASGGNQTASWIDGLPNTFGCVMKMTLIRYQGDENDNPLNQLNVIMCALHYVTVVISDRNFPFYICYNFDVWELDIHSYIL